MSWNSLLARLKEVAVTGSSFQKISSTSSRASPRRGSGLFTTVAEIKR
jgi:hypothetical protein